MGFLVFFAAFVLAAAVHVVGQPGFLSIDCGLDSKYSDYKDISSGIIYVSDGPYVDAGENHKVAPDQESQLSRALQTLRSFPSGVRNCYTLPTDGGTKYLLRLWFVYGNYDGKNSSSLQFDLYLGTNLWGNVLLDNNYYLDTVNPDYAYPAYEAVFVAWASWAPVCLENTGGGTPFVSSVELRALGDALYPPVTPKHSLSILLRGDMGPNGVYFRYPDDPYDRLWLPMASPRWANLSTRSSVQPDASFAEPLPVLQTAVAATGNDTALTFTWPDGTSNEYMVFLHFADFQNSQLRQFAAYLNGNRLGPSDHPYSPPYLAASCVYNSSWYRAPDGQYNVTLVATAASVLPPMLNAIEIYFRIDHDTPTTFPNDFDAIMAIKLEYGVKKNWMGDPCFPPKYAWDGVKCSNTSGNTARITSLDLSNSNLSGVISNNFTLLSALEYLDLAYNNLGLISYARFLQEFHVKRFNPAGIGKNSHVPNGGLKNLSGNHLDGPIPGSLCKNNAVSLFFSYDSDEDMCNKTITSPSRNRTATFTISVVVPVLVVAVLILAFFIWREKRKPNVCTHDPPRETQLENAPGNRKNHGGHLQNTENRQFTYKELEKFTNKFKQLIGQGGFGPVYYGRLEDATEVAVKMRSESSSHGLDQFLAEVQSLTKVHHRNLVSLVGYCWEKDHLALVYEYMCRGSVCDHLRGKNGVAETLNWGTRVRVVLEAAQGLDYLHVGCSLPIVHRDVKTSNILLGQNLQAKIADFGLSKTYLSDTQTHISATPAGSAGYIDPELTSMRLICRFVRHYHTGRLTESSDVYSFGVVVLEVATGESPMLPGHGHIVQRVKQKVATGNISLIADARLGGAYDVNSMWKVVDTAMACTADTAARRPTMAAVVVQLKESLALEEAREDRGVRASPASDAAAAALVSSFGPSAR